MSTRLLAMLLAITASLTSAPLFAVTVLESNMSVTDGHGTSIDASDAHNGTVIPTYVSVDATIDDDFYSRATIDWFYQGSGTVFNYDLSQKRRPEGWGDWCRATETMVLIVETPTDYALSGYYNVIQTVPGDVSLSLQLTRVGDGTQMFWNWQESHSTADESFVLGGTGGDTYNDLHGNLMGTLAPDYYLLHFHVYAAATADAAVDQWGASALGNFKLTLGDITTDVPEPTTFAIWSVLGGLGMIAARRRRKTA